MHSDEHFMRRALELAELGRGHVAPNPLVGAVVVHNGIIIGEGYHERYGEAHAEVNAINAVSNPELLPESTIYVTLEPCAHHGKTPPCADLIVRKQLKRVVIASGDPFSEVNGKGIERMKNAGIEVTTFVLEQEAREMNRHFFTFHEQHRPYVFLKWAQSPDGFIDRSASQAGTITWISRPEVQPLVHQWRAEHSAILVGKNTILNDNPSLNVRLVSGKNPLRVVLDSRCELGENHTVFQDGAPTLVLNTVKNEIRGNTIFVQLNAMEPAEILNALYEREIQSVMIEGGAKTLQSFIDALCWDEACIITGQQNLIAGTPAPHLEGKHVSSRTVLGDQLNFYRR